MARPRQSKLVFFRVNYPHWWGKEAAGRVLQASFSMSEGRQGEYKQRHWYTGEFDRLASGRWYFKLGKAREDLTHSTIRVEKGKYVFPVEGEGPVVPTVRALFDPEHSLLAMETSAEISAGQIKGSLEDVLRVTRAELLKQDVDASLGDIILVPLSNKADFFSWANEMEQVTTISFQFWPTNPNPMKSFEKWDEQQREAKSDETHLTVRSKANGLKVRSEIVETGIAQVQAGYGTASAHGTTAEGVRRTWHSARELVMRVVEWFDDKDKLDQAWSRAARDAEKKAERKHDKKPK